jgi:hypothetical protein
VLLYRAERVRFCSIHALINTALQECVLQGDAKGKRRKGEERKQALQELVGRQ